MKEKINYLDDFIMTEHMRLHIINLHDHSIDLNDVVGKLRPELEAMEKLGQNRKITKKDVFHVVGLALKTKRWD